MHGCNCANLRKGDLQWICCRMFVDHWLIWREKVYSCSEVEDIMVHWGLNFLIYDSITIFSCAVEVYQCFVITVIIIICNDKFVELGTNSIFWFGVGIG